MVTPPKWKRVRRVLSRWTTQVYIRKWTPVARTKSHNEENTSLAVAAGG